MCASLLQILTFAIERCHCENCTPCLDQLFQGKKCQMLISLKEWELAQNALSQILIFVNEWYHFDSYTYCSWPTFFMVKNWKFNISEAVRASVNMWNYFKYLAFWQHFSFLNCKWSLSRFCRFASTCTASAVELLLHYIVNFLWSSRERFT